MDNASSDFYAGCVMILGASAYRSRKERLLELKPATRVGMSLEALRLVIILVVAGFQRDLMMVFISHDPIPFFILPCWAVIAYFCAGIPIKFEQKLTD